MRTSLHKHQQGMVSIMIVMVMMIVITLIIMGFSTVVRRNQRESLDRQLSTQAFYAAETGVDDALTAIKNKTVTDLYTNPTKYSGSCSNFYNAVGAGSNVVGPAGQGVSYSCLFVDPTPPDVEANVVQGAAKSIRMDVTGMNGGFKFSWPASGASSDPTNCPGTLTQNSAAAWTCPYGVLRVELYKNNVLLDPASSSASTIVSLLVPKLNGGGTVGVTFGNPDQHTYVTQADCTIADCEATLTGAALTDGSYYVHMTSMYVDAGKVSVSCGSGCTISGGQVLIDATGKAQDVLRRIQVRVPLDASGIPMPVNALQSPTGICKRFGVAGTGTSAVPDQTASPALCAP